MLSLKNITSCIFGCTYMLIASAMKPVECLEDVAPYAGQVVAYYTTAYAPQGYLGSARIPFYTTYGYVHQKKTRENGREYYGFNLLLGKYEKNNNTIITDDILDKALFLVRPTTSREKKYILRALCTRRARFSQLPISHDECDQPISIILHLIYER